MVINMNKKLVLMGAGLLLTAATASAQKLVTGHVTDAQGQPVMGATVRVPGTKVITTTDANGNFKLSGVPASAKKIMVSYIGMNTATVSVAGNVQVVLKDNELSEAVVIGYGTAKKVGTVVGSVQKVGSEKIAENPTANVADALQGKVAGLQVLNNSGDAGDVNNASITIRGIGSLGASSTPLIVIDGSPAGTGMLSMLNDKDIESVTTLKDASATSIYGSRAANGVIYITTKKGRSGEKAQISVSQKIGWSQLAGKISNQMNSDELLQFQLENGIITPNQYQAYKLHGANTDWQKYFFDNAAPMYNTDFSMHGGSETTTYFVSASYMKQNNLTRVGHFNRYTLRSNLETKPKSWLNFGLKQSVVYTDRRAEAFASGNKIEGNTSNPVVSAFMYAPYWDPYSEKAKKTHIFDFTQLYDFNWLQREMRQYKTNDIIYNGVAYAQITPFKGMTLKSQLGLYATDTRNTQAVSPEMPGVTSGWAYESHGRSSLWTITNTAEYKFSIADKHNVTLLLGQEGIKGSSRGFGVMGQGITDKRLMNLGSATSADSPAGDYSASKYEYLSFFGRADYAFNNRYFVNFTVRNDRSSRFGADNRAANFLSGGAMWRISDEAFMTPAKHWLSDLQLKVSVGTTGNSEVGDYNSISTTGTTQYDGESGWVISSPGNAKLGWEKQIQTNVGLTAVLFERLNIDLNWYNRKTKDMLMTVPLPYTTGFTSQLMNVGGISNRGFEVEVNYDIVRNRDFFANVYANYSFNNTKVDELFNGLSKWPIPGQYVQYEEGKTINFYMPIYAGVDKQDGAPMWYKNGYKGDIVHEYNPETMTKTYSDDLFQDTGVKYTPSHNGGFGFTIGWKGLTLNADFAYVLGKHMINIDYFYATSANNAKNGFNQSKDMLNVWKKPGDITDLPGMNYSVEGFDTRILQNASFLRLKNLTLAYDLPKTWMEATRFFENVRFSFTGRNIFTITKYKGGDPELDSHFALGFFPGTRQYTLGVEVTF